MRPVLGISSTRTGIERQYRPAFIVGAREELLQFPLFQFAIELLDILLGFTQEGVVGFFFEQFKDGFGIVEGTAPVSILPDAGLEIVEFLEGGLGGGLVVPKLRLGGDLL